MIASRMLKAEGPVPRRRVISLACFAGSVPLLVPLAAFLPGGILWAAGAVLALRDPEPAFRRRMGVLLACILILAAAPIETDTSNRGFLLLGGCFLAVILGPALVLGRTDPGVIRFQFLPRRIRKLDLAYVTLSVPLAWAVIRFYWWVNPEMPTHWPLPPEPDPEAIWRLFTGINLVGIWDELFFVNTVFGILRSLFPFRLANAGQTVVYASVLYDMAFTGAGVVIVPLFAWTQGILFEESENLLWVLLVHLIVDFFLFTAIVQHYYPGFSLLGWH